MKRSRATKKFLLWFLVLLLLLAVGFIVWKSIQRSSSMRPDSPWERRGEESTPTNQPPKIEEPGSDRPLPSPDSPAETEDMALHELVDQAYFGWPASPVQVVEVVEYKAFVLGYSEQHEQAAWVAYRMVAQGNTPRHGRQDRFRSDQNITTGSATPDDYSNSGFDRGHLAPAADFATDPEAMQETFYMSNMSPQDPAFNRGIWSKLENRVRDWAEGNQELWVVTGPVLQSKEPFKKIGNNQVSVPRYYYKVILDAREPQIKMIGFLLANEGSSEELTQFVVTVDSIESLTGLDFFPMLPNTLEDELEAQHSPAQWFR